MSQTRERESDSEMRKHVLAVEEELEQVRGLLRTVFDSGPFPMWISDEKGTCVRVNEALRRTWGVREEALIDKYNLFEDPVLKAQGCLPLVQSVFDEGRSVTFQNKYDAVQFNDLSDTNRQIKAVIEATIAPIKNAQGKVTHAIIQQKDLTELTLAQEEKDESINRTKQAQKMEAIGLLASGVALGINRPLTDIRGIFDRTLQALEAQELETQDLSESFRDAVNQVSRISRIINHLRLFGRTAPLSFQEVALETVLDSTLILLGPLLHKNHIILQRNIPERFPLITCDPLRLEQVLIHLFENAVIALTHVRDKEITVTAAAGETHWTLSFKDNGVGRPSDSQDRVFEPFVTAKTAGDRPGLGLSIVYDIVKEHQGEIQYVDESQGSSFVITWPFRIPGDGTSLDD